LLHCLGLHTARCIPFLPLVIRLAAHPNVLTSPGHAQPFDEALCEDLPKGFFTTRTP
jgi:hypothetical protein